MVNYSELGSIHVCGYHGTSVVNAYDIAENGFRDYQGKIYFAPVHDMAFAAQHGRRNANDLGDDEYAIVHARIPPTELVFGLGGDQLEVSPELADKIEIIRILAWKVKGMEPPRLLIENTDL